MRKKYKQSSNFSNFLIGEKKCDSYTKFINALDNSTKEIDKKIIKPYNKEKSDDDKSKIKEGYIEEQMRTYRRFLCKEQKK